ncbi:hypothetical protein MJO28_008985 [Puccinia striiformis f. sp. tritici]|uniref:Uncharacterized protein n=1 Tax=Puccinia striiformis f. sp. tritici TaxID=168172 RepID=A0ACC0ECQ3_9BASI|nr:hypothetical protein MJO28_008985 [Puccinia striiformis f. sp. tritici]
MSHSPSTSITAPSDASSMPSTDCVPRISDMDFARISHLLAPNSSQANPFQPDSFSVAEVTAYHKIVLDLFREFCAAYPAGSVEHRGRVFLYHNLEEVFRSLIWHQVENDKKERDEEKALNAAQNVNSSMVPYPSSSHSNSPQIVPLPSTISPAPSAIQHLYFLIALPLPPIILEYFLPCANQFPSNLAYFSNKQSSPSQLKPVELLDQIELDLIENSYNQMQKEMLQKKEKILDKIKKNLPRTDEEEEWLDNEGNPIDEKLFIDALLGMKDNDPIQATESHIKALHKIMKYSDNIVQLTIKTSAKSKNKKNTAATEPPALKKKKPNKPETNTRIATLCQKVEVLNWHHANGKNQTKTATHFDKLYPELKLTQPRISAWLKDEISIRQNELKTSASVKRVNKTKFETVDKLLEEWTRNAIVAKLVISGDLLREKWKDFARLQGIPSTQWLKLSNGWLDSFKARNNLKMYKKHGEAAQADELTISQEVDRLQKLISRFPPNDVFNMDETGLFYAMPPDRGLAYSQEHGIKSNKTRITIALTCNSTGTEKLPPLFIGKWERPRCFGGKYAHQLGYQYYHNKKAWMDQKIFQHWIRGWDSQLKHSNRNILLLVDNFAGHIAPPEGLKHIELQFLSPNLTSHVQPLDAGIINTFKSHYRRRFMSNAIRNFNLDVTIANIYTIDQLSAMRLSRLSWNSVTRATIKHCWDHTGITGRANQLSKDTDMMLANSELESETSRLETLGIVNESNRMSIADLLNPAGETQDVGLLSSEEIFELHQEAQAIDNKNPKTEPDPVPKPTLREIRSALATTFNYIHHDNSPLADELQNLLDRYSQQIDSTSIKNAQQLSLDSFFKTSSN